MKNLKSVIAYTLGSIAIIPGVMGREAKELSFNINNEKVSAGVLTYDKAYPGTDKLNSAATNRFQPKIEATNFFVNNRMVMKEVKFVTYDTERNIQSKKGVGYHVFDIEKQPRIKDLQKPTSEEKKSLESLDNRVFFLGLGKRPQWSEFNFINDGTSVKVQTTDEFMNLFLNVERKERVGYREVPVKIDLKINPVKTDIKKLTTFSDEVNKSVESIENKVKNIKFEKDFWIEFGAEHVRFAIKDRLNMLTPPVQVAHNTPKNPTADLQKKKQ
ncbi:MAG: hypothetical protein LBU87_04020 [Lactobacillales bacterium]|jgi:hypothetical protein|nr:hypothetical protein [Lactobacillales bacterium]